MIILSKLADYGVIVATQLAATAPRQATAAGLAAATRLPPATVAKLLKLMAKAGLVTAARGAAGGYRLSAPPAEVSVAEVIAAIDGKSSVTQCTGHGIACERHSFCSTRPHWDRINAAVAHALDAVRLSDMVPPTVTLPAFRPQAHDSETITP